jgi:hypothetical protein
MAPLNCSMAAALLTPGPSLPLLHQIHGTCLGFQLLHILVSNVSRNDLLVETDSVAHATTTQLTAAAASSRTFGGMPAELRAKVEDPSLNIILQNHEYGTALTAGGWHGRRTGRRRRAETGDGRCLSVGGAAGPSRVTRAPGLCADPAS